MICTNAAELIIYENTAVQNAMRALGVDEAHVSGTASDFEKWRALCESFSELEGGDVFLGVCSALREQFGINEIPSPNTHVYIWKEIAHALSCGTRASIPISAREGRALCVTDKEKLPFELDGCLCIDADAISDFSPPNPYETELARADVLTASPSRESIAVLARAELRDACIKAYEEGRALSVICTDESASAPLNFVPFFKMLSRRGAHPRVCFCVGKDPERLLVAAEKVAFLYGNVGNDRKRRIFMSRIPQNDC